MALRGKLIDILIFILYFYMVEWGRVFPDMFIPKQVVRPDLDICVLMFTYIIISGVVFPLGGVALRELKIKR